MNFPRSFILICSCIIWQTATLQAFCDDDFYNDQCCDFKNQCDLKLTLYADALYWKFLRADLDIGISGEEDEIFEYLRHDWSWGYRVGGLFCGNNCSMEIRYTSICDQKRTRIGEAKHKYDYNVLDFDVGYTCCIPCCNLKLTPIIGGKFAWIDDDYRKLQFEIEEEGRIDFKGYGLYLGIVSRWQLFNSCICGNWLPISLVGRATTGVLHSKFEIDTNTFENASDEYLYVPVHDLYAALEIAFYNRDGFGAFLQVGYEVQAWQNWREWFSNDDTVGWGIGGLIIRGGFNF